MSTPLIYSSHSKPNFHQLRLLNALDNINRYLNDLVNVDIDVSNPLQCGGDYDRDS